MEIYMQSLEKEVRTAINSIHDELVRAPKDLLRSSQWEGIL
jgi:hypothetical protein